MRRGAMSTILRAKGSTEAGLKRYFEQRGEREFEAKNPHMRSSFNIKDILDDARLNPEAQQYGAVDGMVVRRTSFKNQMRREGRLRKDGSVKQSRRFAGAIKSFADDEVDDEDIEVPWERPARGRRRERPM